MSSDRLDVRVAPANERAFLLAELQHVLDHPHLFTDPEAELARLTVKLCDLQGNGAPIDWRALSARSTWEGLSSRAADAR